MRRLVVDTETTGLNTSEGHRIIEVACVELDDRKPTGNNYHEFFNPEREIDISATKIHGLDNKALAEKPKFAQIAAELFDFIKGAELVIHNAEFDLDFLNHEFSLTGQSYPDIKEVCTIVDTIQIAREQRPGRRNSLDALASEFGVDTSARTTHSALVDAQILVEVYRFLTVGQTSLDLQVKVDSVDIDLSEQTGEKIEVAVIQATEKEYELHEKWLEYLDKKSENGAIWREIDNSHT